MANQSAMRITTGMLNNILEDATARVQPPTDKGRRLKIYYMTQVGVKPPHFVIFCNDARLFHFSYQRYLENQLRGVFGLEGTPIRLTIRQRTKDPTDRSTTSTAVTMNTGEVGSDREEPATVVATMTGSSPNREPTANFQ